MALVQHNRIRKRILISPHILLAKRLRHALESHPGPSEAPRVCIECRGVEITTRQYVDHARVALPCPKYEGNGETRQPGPKSLKGWKVNCSETGSRTVAQWFKPRTIRRMVRRRAGAARAPGPGERVDAVSARGNSSLNYFPTMMIRNQRQPRPDPSCPPDPAGPLGAHRENRLMATITSRQKGPQLSLELQISIVRVWISRDWFQHSLPAFLKD